MYCTPLSHPGTPSADNPFRFRYGRERVRVSAAIKRIIDAVSGQQRVLLMAAALAGLRASELRGLRWDDVDLKRVEVRVHQRADRYGVIGKPKSESAERTIPLGPMLLNTLKEWKLACPKGEARVRDGFRGECPASAPVRQN
jgi:integrase